MKRSQIEKIVEPIIRECLREFGDFTPKGISDEQCALHTKGTLRPDVRRVSLLVSWAESMLASVSGEGLEIGSGYGYLLFPMARFLPKIHWSAVDHPSRKYISEDDFGRVFQQQNCEFVGLDLTREVLPFPDDHFEIATFSEVLEHLPVERVNFVLMEIARVIKPGGVLLASSPNQASLENRLRLLKGHSILDMPDEMATAKGIYGHVRLYTPVEMNLAMSRLGFRLERLVTESNLSGYRGQNEGSWRRRLHRLYEEIEAKLPFQHNLGDTWYMIFRKGRRENGCGS
jgi:SAM-dependent methyltransferase